MIVAIYARKSKTTDQGKSLENQIDTCKEYIEKWTDITNEIDYKIYVDDGFSGANTDRPNFKQLLADAKQRKFNTLVCYRLDRVSRNVCDFTTIYNLLQNNNIDFISVKERFDTSTPLGRAMLNISTVFAQLERETITERITDNMIKLARTGRWLGGTTPTGFSSNCTADINNKKTFYLVPIEHEIQKVQLIFDKYLELKSLHGVETYLTTHNILTKNNVPFRADAISRILQNPVYACADINTYNYLNEKNCDIACNIDSFEGKFGLMVYNRTDQTGTIKKRNYTDWIVAVGAHPATVSGKIWVNVQNILSDSKKSNFYIKPSTNFGVLGGLITCGNCGSKMHLKRGKIKKDGTQAFVYICYTKDKSNRKLCNQKNLIGQQIDSQVIDYILNLTHHISPKSTFNINQVSQHLRINNFNIESQISAKENLLSNLINQLGSITQQSLVDRILNQMSILDNEILELNRQLDNLNYIIDINQIELSLSVLTNLNNIDILHQRLLLKSLIHSIVWNGETITIKLF
ncbi:MAG: hypothetical protein ATN35_13530 [Epulopiscium sp. Nele67-Bin004]|nr:MAG: hypothetical protein ATN35_13530 [Epulopiscium sp. Nele67-Bin004]